MEECYWPGRRHLTEEQPRNAVDSKRGYFHNFLKSQTKRFSSLIISNSICVQDKRVYFKMFLLSLQKPPQQRTEQDELATAKVLNEQNIFPQFQNDLNVLRLFAQNITVRHLEAGEYLLTTKMKDQNIYKIIKGEMIVRAGRDSGGVIKYKGDLIQKIQDFKVIKDLEAECKEQAFLLAISYKSYEQAMKVFLQNKVKLKMLVKTALFSNFKRKELNYLLDRTEEKSFSNRAQLFQEGDTNNEMIYFLVQGELMISKMDESHKKQVACYQSEGSLCGEQSLFHEGEKRSYSASVHSSQARILFISCSAFLQTLTHFEIPKQFFFSKCKYRQFLQRRNLHYSEKLRQTSLVKESCRPYNHAKKMSDGKQQQMANLLRDVENYSVQLTNKQKMLQKKGNYTKDGKFISVEMPLFGRQDFPGWKQFVRRFQIMEIKAKQNSYRLPHLH